MARRTESDADDRFDAVADDLYGLPPADFTKARDAHAVEARKDGDRPLAERIRALRRPTLAAWASNLLVRAQPDEVRGVLELGEALRTAHRDMDGARLRDLSAQQRTLTMALARQARALVADAGQTLSDQALAEVRDTVAAALADPDSGTAWASGRLAHTLTPPAFPAVAPEGTPRRSDRPKSAKAQPAAPGKVRDLGQARARREARERLAAARRDAREAATHVTRRERAAETARTRAQEAGRRHQQARDRLAELQRDLTAAEQARHDAADAERRARHEAEHAEREVAEARRTADAAAAHAERLAAETDDAGDAGGPNAR
ncbi:hypothetical protein GCM10023205_26090 [Yinghuangia aomiensis]|uniref:Transposase n=1 Tax=Yinghuangia aomiensis TaxID=676205 RepID=A0ABP9H4H6_9ACTN